MTNYTIRSATIADLSDIQTLNLRLFEKEKTEYDNTLDCTWTFGPNGESYFTKCIEDTDYCAFVAIADNHTVWYLAGNLKKESTYRIIPQRAELCNMFILEQYRSFGIGTSLYNAFIEWCKSKNAERIEVAASAQNSNAIEFYRKNGFNDYSLTLEAII